MKVQYALFSWLLFAACCLTFLSLFISIGSYLLLHDPKAIDFLAFFTGAKLLAQSPTHLYNLHSQLLLQQRIDPITQANNIFVPFLNPPFVAYIFQILLVFGLKNGYAMWVGINVFLLLVICFVSQQQVTKMKWYYALLFVVGIATFIPVSITLISGQFGIVLCLIFLLSWILLKNGHAFRGGLLLSLLLIKPHFFILPFVAMLMQRRGRLLYGLITGTVLLVGSSYFFVGWSGILQYISILSSFYNTGQGYNLDLMAQHSLQTALLILFHTQSLAAIRIYWLIAIACIGIPTLFVWSKKFSFSSPQFAFQLALLIIATLLTSPHTHFYDLSLLIVVVIFVLSQINVLKRSLRKFFIVFIILGYGISLLEYRLNSLLQDQTQEISILVSVGYLIIFWLLLIKAIRSLPTKSV